MKRRRPWTMVGDFTKWTQLCWWKKRKTHKYLLKRGHFKRKGSSSNHCFQGTFVRFRGSNFMLSLLEWWNVSVLMILKWEATKSCLVVWWSKWTGIFFSDKKGHVQYGRLVFIHFIHSGFWRGKMGEPKGLLQPVTFSRAVLQYAVLRYM